MKEFAYRWFEDVGLGDEFEERWIAEPAQVAAYIAANMNEARDDRFHSQEGAEAVGMRRPIVPGPMSLAVLTKLVTDWMGIDGVLRSLHANFRRPVEQGDELRVLLLITDTDEMSSSAGVVRMDVYLENDRGERPVQGIAVLELPRRESAA